MGAQRLGCRGWAPGCGDGKDLRELLTGHLPVNLLSTVELHLQGVALQLVNCPARGLVYVSKAGFKDGLREGGRTGSGCRRGGLAAGQGCTDGAVGFLPPPRPSPPPHQGRGPSAPASGLRDSGAGQGSGRVLPPCPDPGWCTLPLEAAVT